MGGFYLSSNGNQEQLNAALGAFRNMGLDRHRQVQLGAYTLLILDKALVSTEYDHEDAQGSRVFCVGSMVYGKLYGQQALIKVLQDYQSRKIDYEQFSGAFCLLLWVDQQLYLLRDSQGVYRVWHDERTHAVSSSLLALVAQPGYKVNLDKEAILLNLICGYQVGGDSWVQGISLLDQYSKLNSGLNYIQHTSQLPSDAPVGGSLEDHAQFQLQLLDQGLSRLAPLLASKGVEIGISGGYDSRLLLAALDKYELNTQAHTFDKEGDLDPVIAEHVAQLLAVPLRKIKRTTPEGMDTRQQEDQLLDCINFFDGQISNMMHLFGNEYSIKYRKELATEQHQVVLSGVGGEIYRNHNFNPLYACDLSDWIHYYVFSYPVYASITDPSVRKNLTQRLVEAISTKLTLDKPSLNFQQTKEYYTKFFIPAWHGLRNSCENKYGYYFSPFVFPEIVENATRSHRFSKHGGALEAKMIELLNYQVAALTSSYGHNFVSTPWSLRLQQFLKSNLPVPAKLLLGNYAGSNSGNDHSLSFKFDIFENSFNALKELDFPINWGKFMANPSRRLFALSVGAVVDHLRKTAL